LESSQGTELRRRGRGGTAGVSRETVGRCATGEEIVECRLTNSRGTEAAILTLGATLRTCVVADASGEWADVVLGFDTVEEYLSGNEYFGATVGRYANRIANGRFSIGAASHQLELNAPPHAEHGGREGFHRRLWRIEDTDDRDGAALTLSLVSPDGDQGYPGRLEVRLTYRLTNDDELRLEYRATTSRLTVLNLTHHSYWTLSEAGATLDARLRIDADSYAPVNSSLIPTGAIAPVEGTPFDFRAPTPISSRIRDGSCPQLVFGRGYDHNFVLRPSSGSLRMAARLEDSRSGRVLEVLTTEPGLQLYTANFLNGGVSGKNRRLYRQGDGIALETQHFPDSPNHPQFPTTVLEPGHVWRSATTYRFSTLP
jgi:aldose 1-epimerase